MTTDDWRRRLHEWLTRLHREKGEAGLREAEAIWTSVLAEFRFTAEPLAAPEYLPKDRSKYKNIIGDSKPMLGILGLIDRVAMSTVPVLIQGESGTGKELIAKAVHEASPRADKPFIAENCAAVPETLLESELFGYKKGAFTGADRERQGLFEVADKGTLFLDEVGDMSLSMQKKLLRALQDGEIRPVGSSKSLRVDVRVISASNKRLRDQVREGHFREDLLYRLNTVTLELPPLRDRPEDVPALVAFFVKRIAHELGIQPPDIEPEAMEKLEAYHWPGNIRELENEIRRALALLNPGSSIGPESLSPEIAGM